MSDQERVPLEPLDPGFGDAGFWMRFQDRVMRAAGPELARRRWMPELTVSQVVLSWGRMLVPVSVAAALLATVILLQEDVIPFSPEVEGIEELLLGALDDEAHFLVLRADEPPDAAAVLLAIERH
jgi:hypothetical protein